MDDKAFWQIIEDSKQASPGDADVQLNAIKETLEKLSADEVAEYDRVFSKYYSQSYRWNLWAAAYLINGGCSDDGFDYFRAGLIIQGEKIFKDALRDPESLADVLEFYDGELSHESEWAMGVEEAIYLASKIYEAKTGKDMPYHENPPQDMGEPWDEDKVQYVLPKLAKHCGYDD
jgi:hypothetical protein